MARYLYRSLLYYLLTGLFISGLAFVNHYPLVYSDSGSYIANSRTLFQYDDRPIGYGLIMRAVTWQGTLWTMVIFQGALASWLLMLVVREVVPEAARWLRVHLVLITLLIICSSLPWYSAQIMADHFTPLVLIIAFLIFNGRAIGPWREAVLWLFLFFLLATQNALLLMVGAVAGWLLWSGVRNVADRRRPAFWIRWSGFIAVIGGATLMIMLFDRADHGRMQVSRAGNVFLAGRLCEGGIMADYLKEVCPLQDNPLCKYKDSLPGDAGGMLWDEGGFVNQEHISIGQADSLLAPVVSDILRRPEYFARFVRSALVSTAVQLFQWDAGAGLAKYGERSSPYFNLDGKIPDEMYSYTHSRQQWGMLMDLESTNRRIAITLILSLLVLAFQWIGRHDGQPPVLLKLSRWIIAWVMLNAAITSSFSVVDPRYQSRVMWLLTMAAFLVLVQQPSLRAFFRLGPERKTIGTPK